MSEYLALSQAAKNAKTSYSALYQAIMIGRLKFEKKCIFPSNPKRRGYAVTKEDVDAYRASKFIRENIVVNGEKIFDLAKGNLSVLQASKILSTALNRKFPVKDVYLLLRSGRIKAHKKGMLWVIHKDEIARVCNQLSKPDLQMSF